MAQVPTQATFWPLAGPTSFVAPARRAGKAGPLTGHLEQAGGEQQKGPPHRKGAALPPGAAGPPDHCPCPLRRPPRGTPTPRPGPAAERADEALTFLPFLPSSSMSPRAAPAARPGSPTASGRYMLALGPPPPRSARRPPARSLRPGRAPPALPDLGSQPTAETPPPRAPPTASALPHFRPEEPAGPKEGAVFLGKEGFHDYS